VKTSGWELRLRHYLETERSKSFSWADGVDCITLIAGAALVMTSDDILADVRGLYSSEDEAKALLRRLGFEDMAGALASRYTEIPLSQASFGDFVVMPFDDIGTCGVLWGPYVYLRAEHGLGLARRSRALAAFKVE
jgi:hypothetical protein